MRSCGGDDDVDDDGVRNMNTMNTQRLCRPQVWWRRGFSSAWLNEPTSGWRTEACRFGILQSTESPATISHLTSTFYSQVPWSRFTPLGLRLCWRLLQNWTKTAAGTFSQLSKTRYERGSLDFSHRAGGAADSVSLKCLMSQIKRISYS